MFELSDMKYAIRLLYKRPGFTALTTLVMAIGLGLSIYLFSFFNTVIFKPLPFSDGGSLVQISRSYNGGKSAGGINLHDYAEIQKTVRGLTEFSAYQNISVNLASADAVRRYSGVKAQANLFELTRVQPLLGRTFLAAEDQPGAEKVVVLGYDVWQNQFAGDQQILTQSIKVNGVSHRVIGVMPQGYLFPSTADLWLPMQEKATTISRNQAGSYFGLAHLTQDADVAQINQQIALVMQRMEKDYPQTNKGVSAYVSSIQMTSAADGIAVVYAMQVAAILILLLASVNVANLLFARAVERGKETAIRVALGAPKARLIGQMVWESIFICGLGGLIGLALLAWGLEATNAITAQFFIDKPNFWWQFSVDGYTLKIFFVFLLGSILVTGVLPAIKNAGGNFNEVLRDGTRGALGRNSGRLNRTIVISEVFLSLIILIIASVVIIGTVRSTQADIGADPEGFITAEVLMTEQDYPTAQQRLNFVNALASSLSTNKGLSDVVITTALPGKFTQRPNVAVEGKEYTQQGKDVFPKANYILLTTGSLEKLGVRLVKGRYFNASDEGADKTSVIITDSFAQKYFQDAPALGQRVRIVKEDTATIEWLTVVGIVGHTQQGSANSEHAKLPSLFRPYSQDPQLQLSLAVKSQYSFNQTVEQIRSALQTLDAQLPAYKIESYQDNLARMTAALVFITYLLSMFGVAALALSASGIYGVMSNTIVQRYQEIGVKRALGATEGRILLDFRLSGLKQLCIGGLPALGLGGFIGVAMSQSIGLLPTDLIYILLGVSLVVLGVVLLAVHIPTQKALTMEPIVALRGD